MVLLVLSASVGAAAIVTFGVLGFAMVSWYAAHPWDGFYRGSNRVRLKPGVSAPFIE
jgi:hypothetical protein